MFAETGPPYRSVGTLIYLRLVDQRRLEVGQVPLGEGALLDLLLLLPLIFEGNHLIVGSQVVSAAAAKLRHGCSPPPNLATCRTLLGRVSRKVLKCKINQEYVMDLSPRLRSVCGATKVQEPPPHSEGDEGGGGFQKKVEMRLFARWRTNVSQLQQTAHLSPDTRRGLPTSKGAGRMIDRSNDLLGGVVRLFLRRV